jgi:hypothetical protein
MLELGQGMFLLVRPLPGMVLVGKDSQRFNNCGIALDES